jgi:hypothetical protein
VIIVTVALDENYVVDYQTNAYGTRAAECDKSELSELSEQKRMSKCRQEKFQAENEFVKELDSGRFGVRRNYVL